CRHDEPTSGPHRCRRTGCAVPPADAQHVVVARVPELSCRRHQAHVQHGGGHGVTRRRAWLETALSLVAFIALWEVVARLVGGRFPVVPPPSAIAAVGAQASYPIWLNLRLTLIEAGLGLIAGSVFGLLLAATFAAWPRTEASLY